MQTPIILCFLNWLFGASSQFISITVAKDVKLHGDVMNQTMRESVEIHCKAQCLRLNQSSDGSCTVYKWSYEPSNNELICVCKMNDVIDKSALLWQEDLHSRAVPAIPQDNFAEGIALGQGCFGHILKIWTISDIYTDAYNLFTTPSSNNVSVLCMNVSGQIDAYQCTIVHCNTEKVSWDYPENWIGPARSIRYLTYDTNTIAVQVLGIYWPAKQPAHTTKQLHVDTVMLVEEGETDICKFFLTKIKTAVSEPKPKCRVEFLEKTVDCPLPRLARLNLQLILGDFEQSTPYETALALARYWKMPKESCVFPLQIRQEIPTYVPSQMISDGNLFEFMVTFNQSGLEYRDKKQISAKLICKRLMKFSEGMVERCNIVKNEPGYGVASVSIASTNKSVWLAQLELMMQLNSRKILQCHFNVETKPEPKYTTH